MEFGAEARSQLRLKYHFRVCLSNLKNASQLPIIKHWLFLCVERMNSKWIMVFYRLRKHGLQLIQPYDILWCWIRLQSTLVSACDFPSLFFVLTVFRTVFVLKKTWFKTEIISPNSGRVVTNFSKIKRSVIMEYWNILRAFLEPIHGNSGRKSLIWKLHV